MKPKSTPHYLGHRNRVKNKFLKEPGSFADYELLELLLFSSHPRKDVKPLAKKLLSEFGSISAVINASPELLNNISEANDNVLVSLKLIKEFSNKLSKEKLISKPVISNWQHLIEYCRTNLVSLKEEQFRILFLDKKYNLIADELQQKGKMEEVEIDLKSIVKKTLNYFCDSIILLHNHPNSDAKPSKADISATKKIVEILNAINIKVYDHLIVGQGGEIFSFKREGFL